MDDTLEILDPFERPEEYPPRPSATAFLRRLRMKFVPRTIKVHEGDLGAVIRYPLGATWRRHQGRDWCPVCTSISPYTLLREMAKLTFWDRERAAAELKDLIERNEIIPSDDNWHRVMHPPSNTGYGSYNYDPSLGRFESFVIVTGSDRFGFNLVHLYDLSLPDRALAVSHLNRLAPGVHWEMESSGALWCSTTSLVIYHDDDDEEDPDNQEETEDE